MLLIPSIDLRGGTVVRLLHGDFDRETVFSADPVGVVSAFAAAGARRVHIVDLDGARGNEPSPSAAAAVAAVRALADLGVEAQVGGGVRGRAVAQRWFDAGASHVVIGSLALHDPAGAEALCAAFPERVFVALDVRDGAAQGQGWTEAAGDANAHLDAWKAWPTAGIVFTAIERDGALEGPAVAALGEVCRRSVSPVIASGGITTIADVEACDRAGAAGVIVGRALHEGLFDLAAALAHFPAGSVA